MRKFIKALVIILLLISPLSVKVEAESLTDINELIENAKQLDGQEVTVQGEAIGESMDRGDYSWININDGTNAIGIWLKNNEADKIFNYGDYDNIGDTVKITGIFYRACKEHGGEADFHGRSLEIVEDGYQTKETISSTKVICAMILILLAFLSLVVLIKFMRARGYSKAEQ